MRHQTELDRATKSKPMQNPYVCEYGDCKRVVWVRLSRNENVVGYATRKEFKVESCYECGRESVYTLINVPNGTVMLDKHNKPITKSDEKEIPVKD